MDNTTPLPRFDDHPAAWFGPDMAAHPGGWTWQLRADQVRELNAAVQHLDGSGRDIVTLTAVDARLDSLRQDMETLNQELLQGNGFKLIRGVPVEGYSRRQAAIAFWLLGAQLGIQCPQNAKGHLLGHVRDLGFDYGKPSARAYQTSALLPFHCDTGGDVVALMCLRGGRFGGLSRVVSSVSLYNHLVEKNPDAVRTLMQPLYRDRRDEVPEGAHPWYRMPAFCIEDGRLICSYSASTVVKAQRFDDVPRLTLEQIKAMAAFDTAALDPSLKLDMEFRPGDVQFLCNHVTLHSRTGFVDWDKAEKKRHLLRQWLACPNGPTLPSWFAQMQGLNAAGRPRGIVCPGATPFAPLEPEDGGAGDSTKRVKEAAV
jgi:hypothetical protein